MQAAEKLTPTFVIKLVVLFALLLIGVFYRATNVNMPLDASNFEHPTTADLEQSAIEQTNDASI